MNLACSNFKGIGFFFLFALNLMYAVKILKYDLPCLFIIHLEAEKLKSIIIITAELLNAKCSIKYEAT